MKLKPAQIALLLVVQYAAPAFLQSVQSRHYRPHPDKCDRHGRCSSKDGYIEEAYHDEDYRSDKDRPTELTRDDWPIRPPASKPDVEKDSLKPDGIRTSGGGYNSKPIVEKEVKPLDRDSDIKPARPGGEGYGGGYNPKPIDRDDDLKPAKPGARGGYDGGYQLQPDELKPARPGGGGYNPKPIDRDDDLKPARPGGGGGYDGGYKPEPVNRDDELKPVRPSRGGYGGGNNPKPVERDDNIKPVRPGGGYNPKPLDRDDDIKPVRPGGDRYDGGYNPKPVDRDDELKPVRPSGGGGYGGYNPKPVDRDGDKGGGGYGGGYNPKPTVDRGDYDKEDGVRGRPGGGYNTKPDITGGGYDSKHDEGDYKIKPARGGGGYSDDDYKPTRKDHGGYDKNKDNDYNDDYKYGGSEDDEYDDDSKPPLPIVDGNCICVPYYQCTDGHIVTDGSGIIDARKKKDPTDELPLDGKFKPPSCGPFHVCCNTPETSTVKPYEHRCGVRNPSGINSRILSPSNKGEADFGEWPWQAAVLKAEGKVNIFQCGGVIIDKYHVITVAHCVYHLYQFNEYPLKVRLGEWDTQTTTEFLAHEDYRVSKIIVHPEYRNSSLWNDIAVLRLQDPVLFAPHIDTVCLPQYDESFDGQNCIVTGWGKDAYKGGTFSNVMKEVALQVIDNYKCEEMLRKTRLGRFFQLHQGFLCAGGEYGLDSCKGDGGGPLVCYRKDKSYALAGIVSWGIDCGQPGVPGVYVKIQKYLEWISKTTGVALQEYWPKT